MDQQVIKYYRQLLRHGFTHIGKMENPDVFIDSLGEKIQVCGSIGRAYMHIFLRITDDLIEKISYVCTCDPTANVVIEILCSLIEGKRFSEAEKLTAEDFVKVLDTNGEEFRKRATATIELVNRGLERYKPEKTAGIQ